MNVTVSYLTFENAEHGGHMDVKTTIENVTEKDLIALQVLCCGAFATNEFGEAIVKDKSLLLQEIKNGSAELQNEYMVDVDFGRKIEFQEFEASFDDYCAERLMERAADNLSQRLSDIYYANVEYVPDDWTQDDGEYTPKEIIVGSLFAYTVNQSLVASPKM